MFLPILIAAIIIMLASLAGIVFLWKSLGRVLEKNLSLLVSFSAGVFLLVVIQLLREVFVHGSSVGMGILWAVVGVVGVLLLFRFLPAFHHHHDEHHEDDEHSHIDARRIMLGDAMHNIGDGVLLAVAFSVSVPLGIATAVSIFVHEFVQEASEFFVLRQAGLSTKKALLYNFSVSATILIGAIGGYFLLESFSALEVPLLAISAGAFLVVVLHDLIPDAVRNSQKKKSYAKHIAFFELSELFLVVVVINSVFDVCKMCTQTFDRDVVVFLNFANQVSEFVQQHTLSMCSCFNFNVCINRLADASQFCNCFSIIDNDAAI
jgi:zinc and cadmium transporter